MIARSARPLVRAGLVAGLAAVGVLACACGAGHDASSDRPTTEQRTPGTAPKPDRAKPGSPAAEAAKDHLTGQTGFTIRHLEDGHVKEIDVPDFER